MDVATKHLDALLLVGLEQRCAGEADKHGIGQNSLHRLVQFAGLGAVALVDEHIKVALGAEVRRQALAQLLQKLFYIGILSGTELVDQRAQQPGRGLVEFVDQIGTAGGTHDLFVDAGKYLLDLLIQLGAVGDDQHPRVLNVFANPFGQPDHGQGLTRALCVPDDPALALPQIALRLADAEVLIVPAELLHSAVEYDVIVDQLQKTRLVAQLKQMPIQQIVGNGAVRVFLFPGEVVLLAGLDGAVAQALAIVTSHHVLHGGEERLDKFSLLVIQVLPDTLVHRHFGTLQLQHAQRNTIHIEHDIRALGVGLSISALDGDFLGNREVVALRMLPVDQPHRLGVLTHLGLDLHSIAQQFVHRLVTVIQPLAGIVGDPVKLEDGAADQIVFNALLHEPTAQ